VYFSFRWEILDEAGPLDPIPFTAMSKIDVHRDDRGLAACLRGSNLQPDWIESYVRAHHIATLDDFVYMIQATEWERSLGEHVEQVEALKGNRIASARFKSAFEAGQQALKHAAQVAPNFGLNRKILMKLCLRARCNS
jgi:hypothetical protein